MDDPTLIALLIPTAMLPLSAVALLAGPPLFRWGWSNVGTRLALAIVVGTERRGAREMGWSEPQRDLNTSLVGPILATAAGALLVLSAVGSFSFGAYWLVAVTYPTLF